MNLTPSFQKGALCCALSFPAFFLFQFLFPAAFVLKTPELVATTCVPTIECREDYTALLYPVDPGGFGNDATATIHAADLVVSAASDCSNSFHYSIYFLYQIESGEVIPQAIHPDSIVVNCNYCGRGNFRLYAWDDQYNPDSVQPDGTIGGPNYSYCEIIVLISDAFSICNCDYQSIFGIVETIEGEPLKGVNIHLNGTYDLHKITNTQGDYYFSYVSHGLITPQLDTQPLNGISTLDVVLISRHILGIQPLNSPYNRIAADINHDNKITLADVLWLKRLILGIDSTFTNNTTWRFVPESYQFPVPTNPWFEPFPEVLNVTQFSDFILYANFIAVKIGDVNGSAVTTPFVPETESPDPRGATPERTIQPYLQPAPEYGAAIKAVTDTCAPEIQCLEGLTFDAGSAEPGLGGGIIATLQGADLVANAGSTCSNSLQFSVYRSDDVVSGDVVPGPNQDSVILNCAQDCEGPVVLWVYVWDDNFNPEAVQPDGTVGGPNYAWCETYVLINSAPFCVCGGEGLITISGYVKNESGVGVNNVSVSLTGSASATTSTNASGYYAFNNLTPGGSYTVTPEKDVFHLNGVSVADAILLSKHILGLQPLGSPYKMIAGDVNNDKKLTTIDLIHLRKLILAIDTAFVANTSWRFVWAGYDFPVPTNPWFEPFIEGGGPDFDFEEDTQIDFVAIKIGDVNGSAATTPFAPETELSDPRGAAPERTIQPYLQAAPEYGAEIGMVMDTSGPGVIGLVQTEDGQLVANVKVVLSNSVGDTVFIGPYGSDIFDTLAWDPAETYTFTPYLDSMDLNGVSPMDFILIFRHIIGTQPLGSPYQRIAADLNGDNQITNLDLIQYRRLILGLDNELTNNTSWRFVPSDYVFPDPTNPWLEMFPESKTIPGSSIAYWPDFIAIKVGDVNNSAGP